MAIGARAVMTTGIEWEPAERARWPTGLDEQCGPNGEGSSLLLADDERGGVGGGVTLERLDHDLDSSVDLVDGDRQFTGDQIDAVVRAEDEVEVVGEVAGAAHRVERTGQIRREDGNLLLLDLDGDRVKALNALKEKDATADLSNGADGEAVRIAKDVIGHEGLSSWSDAVELTVRT